MYDHVLDRLYLYAVPAVDELYSLSYLVRYLDECNPIIK